MMDSLEYKKLQLDRISGIVGTSRSEVLATTLSTHTLMLIWRVCILQYFKTASKYHRLAQFYVIVLPQIMAVIFPKFAYFLMYLGTLMTICIVVHKWYKGISIFEEPLPKESGGAPIFDSFRGLNSLLTVFAILAVDFMTFPKQHAKTSSFGISLMDIGVGLVIIISGFGKHLALSSGKSSALPGMRNTLLLLTIGLLRLLALRASNYQTHVIEYGVHWNFFFTLALVPLLSAPLVRISQKSAIPCMLITLIHQSWLSNIGSKYILGDADGDRLSGTSFIDQNREGIFGLTGYIVLYLAGVRYASMNSDIFNTEFKNNKQRYSIQNAFLALSQSQVLNFLLMDLCKLDASRRTVNASYISWMVLFSSVHMVAFYAQEMLVPYYVDKRKAPGVLTGYSKGQFQIFMLCNLMTGMINNICQTLSMDAYSAGVIQIGYMAIATTMSWLMVK